MVAVGDRALADIPLQKPLAAGDRPVEIGGGDARLPGDHQREREHEPGLVHAAVAVEIALGAGEGVAPGADAALAAGDVEGQPLEARLHRLVAGGEHILGQEERLVGVAPGDVAAGPVLGDRGGILLHQRQVLLVAAGEQRQAHSRSSGIEIRIWPRPSRKPRSAIAAEPAARIASDFGQS